MDVTVVGLGYVGLTGAAVFAHLGHRVLGVDIDRGKLSKLHAGTPVIQEPGLEELLAAGLRSGSITFVHNDEVAREPCDIVMVAVNTPSSPYGAADLSQVMSAVRWAVEKTSGPTVLLMKSSVPPGSGARIIGKELSNERLRYVANPEFLRQGHAIQDWLHPNRIVLGAQTGDEIGTVEALYSGIEAPIVRTDVTSAEMIKYASNALLVTKISFINEIAALCEQVGGDIDDVARGVGLDPRLGPAYLGAGLGWGGSCFPKDVRALESLALENGRSFDLLSAVVSVNEQQRFLPVHALKEVFGDLGGVGIAVLGLTFKPGTDDLREAPSLDLISALVAEGAHVSAYDPVAVEQARSLLPATVDLRNDAKQALDAAQAAVLVTEWPEIVGLPWKEVVSWMTSPRFIFDGRNALDMQGMRRLGFRYRGVGRGSSAPQPGDE